MRDMLIVGSGGFVGTVARFYLGTFVTQATTVSRFPFGTLAVNVVGCLVIGALGGIAEQSGVLAAQTRLFLFTGLLGGFTTYSAFAYETVFLAREHTWGLAAANVGAQIALGLGAVWLGHTAARSMAG
jgi:CrcB protein